MWRKESARGSVGPPIASGVANFRIGLINIIMSISNIIFDFSYNHYNIHLYLIVSFIIHFIRQL